MAEAAEIPKTEEENTVVETNMEVEVEAEKQNGDGKRSREEDVGTNGENGENGEVAKKQKVEKSVEVERLEDAKDKEEDEEKSESVSLGPKSFSAGVEMFEYFYNLLHFWPTNVDINKYEHMALVDLLKKGHPEPEKKIGGGIRAFQVRFHPLFKSRCFFLIREDDFSDDFSFRKCVGQILPLPEEMTIKADANKGLGGRGGKGGGGGRGYWGKGGGGRGGGGGRRGRGRGRN